MHTQLEHGQPVTGMTFAEKLHLYLLSDVKGWQQSTPSLSVQMKKKVAPAGGHGGWQPLDNSYFEALNGNSLRDHLITTIPGGEENVINVEGDKHGPRAPVDIG